MLKYIEYKTASLMNKEISALSACVNGNCFIIRKNDGSCSSSDVVLSCERQNLSSVKQLD